jgi:hypothetical protein
MASNAMCAAAQIATAASNPAAWSGRSAIASGGGYRYDPAGPGPNGPATVAGSYSEEPAAMRAGVPVRAEVEPAAARVGVPERDQQQHDESERAEDRRDGPGEGRRQAAGVGAARSHCRMIRAAAVRPAQTRIVNRR